MDIKFIGQGFSQEDKCIGDYLIETLKNKNFNKFSAFVAFVSTGGLSNIEKAVNGFKRSGGEINLYIGVDFQSTSKEALEKLIEWKLKTSIVYSPNRIVYHPKIYTFEGESATKLLIGSSNLTEGGLFQNVESSIMISFNNNEDDDGKDFLAELYDYFNLIILGTHKSCVTLTKQLLTDLLESKVVLSEKNIFRKINTVGKEFTERNIESDNKIKEIFGKIKLHKIPVVRKAKIFSKKIVTKDDKEILIDYMQDIPKGSMWIETGMMTGGSRNILDLSKHGKKDDKKTFGSVSFFGINSDKTKIRKDINILYNNKTYFNNSIFFAIDNSNWRIQLKGESKDGQKLTEFSIPTLGKMGGFQKKILVFEKITSSLFKMIIFDEDVMDNLKAMSKLWTRGGTSGLGRAYGII